MAGIWFLKSPEPRILKKSVSAPVFALPVGYAATTTEHTMPDMPSPALASIAVSARRILVLGVLAGYVDALSFAHLGGLFASAMTGNTTHLSAAVTHANTHHALLLTCVLAIFFGAALMASLARLRWGGTSGIGLMACLLLVVQAAQSGSHARLSELVLLPALMAVQGEGMARFSGNAIQTVVITSNMLKCASALATALAIRCGASSIAPQPAGSIVLPALSWGGFASGAMLGALALLWAAPLPFVWPLPWLALLYVDIRRTKRAGQAIHCPKMPQCHATDSS